MKLACTLFSLLLGYSALSRVPKVENNQLVLDNSVLFQTGSADLTVEGLKTLQQVKDFLLSREYVSLLRIETHTDNAGAESGNQELSEKRSLAASKWLVANGIDCKKLLPVGLGSTKPIDDNATPAGKAANRRTVFVLAALRGKAIGGMPVDGGGRVAGDPCD